MPDGSTQPIHGNKDWARLAAMSEEEIEANALSDPDNAPLTEEELAHMRGMGELRRIRRRLNLPQEEFAGQFQIPLGTLRDWEQGRKTPDSAASAFLRVIAFDPDTVRRALAS
jgi:putative transcriptional regulator